MTEALDAEHGEVPADLLTLFEVLEFKKMTSKMSTAALTDGAGLYVPRSAWGARAPREVHINITPVELAVHWEGPHMGDFPHSSCPTKVRGIQAYHMDQRGWDDIAYSDMVCPHGYVFEGRGLGHRTAANGTNDGNNRAYAVCYLSGDSDLFTEEAKHGFWAAAVLLGMSQRTWFPHNHYFNTSCPGPQEIGWIAIGHPDNNSPLPAPTPIPAPVPQPSPQPLADPVGERIKELQRLLGVDDDAIMGPQTQKAMQGNMLGWTGYVDRRSWPLLHGNENRALVAWVQRQCTRKIGIPNRYPDDGILGPNTNDGIVNVLGQLDGICGPVGFTNACR
jgi:hypothetical protein